VEPRVHQSLLAVGDGYTAVLHGGAPASFGHRVLRRGVLRLPEGLAELPRSWLGLEVAPVKDPNMVRAG
jgi:hypothetical protein